MYNVQYTILLDIVSNGLSFYYLILTECNAE